MSKQPHSPPITKKIIAFFARRHRGIVAGDRAISDDDMLDIAERFLEATSTLQDRGVIAAGVVLVWRLGVRRGCGESGAITNGSAVACSEAESTQCQFGGKDPAPPHAA